jgi:NAD+ diphosphatase
VAEDGAPATPPRALDAGELGVAPVRTQYLGALDGVACLSGELRPDAEAPPGMAFATLRSLHGRLSDDHYAVAGRAAQVVEWDRSHQFCGRCGGATLSVPGQRAKRCTVCGHLVFPRLSPAVITLVERGEEVLLARGTNRPQGIWSVIAGFVDPGESLEEAVVREIREEVGIEVDAVRYFGSQPWPYPHSLMVGFTARHAGGELRVDDDEIAEAGWFRAGALPRIPPPLSIARTLIDDWAERTLRGE